MYVYMYIHTYAILNTCVQVEEEELDHRTAIPPVTTEVVKEAPSLFTHEVPILFHSFLTRTATSLSLVDCSIHTCPLFVEPAIIITRAKVVLIS